MDKHIRIILPAVRANTRMSQQEFADKIGVSRETIANWESGKGEPTMTHLRKMSEISGIPMDFIWHEKQS